MEEYIVRNKDTVMPMDFYCAFGMKKRFRGWKHTIHEMLSLCLRNQVDVKLIYTYTCAPQYPHRSSTFFIHTHTHRILLDVVKFVNGFSYEDREGCVYNVSLTENIDGFSTCIMSKTSVHDLSIRFFSVFFSLWLLRSTNYINDFVWSYFDIVGIVLEVFESFYFLASKFGLTKFTIKHFLFTVFWSASV